MPRANRFHLPGYVWHLTHRCHHGDFLLKFARDRRLCVSWLFPDRHLWVSWLFPDRHLRVSWFFPDRHLRVSWFFPDRHLWVSWFFPDRHLWVSWLFDARKRFDLCVLNYQVTSNHVHLVVRDRDQGEIANSMQLLEGCTAAAYNHTQETTTWWLLAGSLQRDRRRDR